MLSNSPTARAEGKDPEVAVPSIFLLVHESRSGSTFLADLLSRHPEVSIAPESSLLRNVWRWNKQTSSSHIETQHELADLLDHLFRDPKLRSWGIDPGIMMSRFSSRLPVPTGSIPRCILVEYGRLRHPGSTIYGVKRGGWNSFNLRRVRALLPGVQVIHIVRDGRAVYASEKRAVHHRTGRAFQKSPGAAAWRWAKIIHSFQQVEEAGLEVRYEELIRSPNMVLTRLLEFLRRDATPGVVDTMLRPHTSDYVPPYVAQLHTNVGKQPLVDRIDGWKTELSPGEIRAFERVAGRSLLEKGYPLLTPKHRSDALFRRAVDLQQRLNRRLGPHRWRKSKRDD